MDDQATMPTPTGWLAHARQVNWLHPPPDILQPLNDAGLRLDRWTGHE